MGTKEAGQFKVKIGNGREGVPDQVKSSAGEGSKGLGMERRGKK